MSSANPRSDLAGTVAGHMSGAITPVRPDTTLVEAAQKMRASGVGGIPIIDREGKECVGILTERDVVIRVLAEERDPRAVFVRDVATLHPVTCDPQESVELAASRMREYEIQHLPVVDEGAIVGMISLADIVFGRPDEERGMITPDQPDAPNLRRQGANSMKLTVKRRALHDREDEGLSSADCGNQHLVLEQNHAIVDPF